MTVNLTISLTLQQFEELKRFLNTATEIPIYSAGDPISRSSADFNRDFRERAFKLLKENPVLNMNHL